MPCRRIRTCESACVKCARGLTSRPQVEMKGSRREVHMSSTRVPVLVIGLPQARQGALTSRSLAARPAARQPVAHPARAARPLVLAPSAAPWPAGQGVPRSSSPRPARSGTRARSCAHHSSRTSERPPRTRATAARPTELATGPARAVWLRAVAALSSPRRLPARPARAVGPNRPGSSPARRLTRQPRPSPAAPNEAQIIHGSGPSSAAAVAPGSRACAATSWAAAPARSCHRAAGA